MKKVLSFIAGIFKKRWFWTLLILIVLSLFVWFLLPFISVGDTQLVSDDDSTTKLVIILILVLLWGLDNLIFGGGKKEKDDEEEEDEEEEEEEEPEIDEDAETVKRENTTIAEKFKNFVSIFTAARGATGGRRQLYTMPWYLMIGAKNSGKSEFVANSDQPFPLARELRLDPEVVKSTSFCEWWVSDQAVFIDTAGRFTTQSEPPIDNPGWLQILKQIRKYRPRKPLNGVIVTVDIGDLMVCSSTELAAQADAIRRRLNEVSRQLGTLYPVYVVFTKLDKVAGALEFFDNLGRDERKQVFGITLDDPDAVRMGNYKQDIDEEFDRLVSRLNDRLLPRVQDERDPSKRDLVYGFPQRLSGLRKILLAFLGNAFAVDRYHEPQLLRGIYFTSACQLGSPVDPLATTVAEEYAVSRASLPPYSGRGREFFIKELLQDIVFREKGFAGSNRRVENRSRLLRLATIIGGGLLVTGMALAWFTGSQANQEAVTGVRSALEAAQDDLNKASQTRNPAHLRPALDNLRDAAYRFNPEEDPMVMGLGLYQGEEIHNKSVATYTEILHTELLPRVQEMAKFRLLQQETDPQIVLDTLRVYLMLTMTDRLDSNTIVSWFEEEWKRRYPSAIRQRELIVPHLQAAFRVSPKPLEMNLPIVRAVRNRLQNVSRAERLYNYIRQSAKSELPGSMYFVRNGIPDLYDVFELKETPSTFGSVPNFYTYEGFHDYFLDKSYAAASQSASEEWILGLKEEVEYDAADVENVAGGIRSLYLADYIATWQGALQQLNVRSTNNLTNTKSLVTKMSDESSPVLRLLQLVKYHTTLYQAPITEGEGADADSGIKAGRILGGKAGKVAAQASKAGRVADAVGADDFSFGAGAKVGIRVNQAFARLHALLDAPEGKDADIVGIMATLAGMSDTITLISIAPSPGEAALDFAKTRMGSSEDDSITTLREVSKPLPIPLNKWFLQTADTVWEVTLMQAQIELNRLWDVEVYRLYEQGLKGRYPLNRFSEDDIPVADFSNFFGPDGVVDTYVSTHLAPFVDTNVWKKRYRDGRSIEIRQNTLDTLGKADLVKNTFFAKGAEPSLGFTIKPLTLDASIGQSILEIEGQQLVYYHGPQRGKAFEWPGADPTGISRLVFQEVGSTKSVSIKGEGHWSLFRLFDSGEVQPETRERFQLKFIVGGREARYYLLADSVVNPFGKTNPLTIELPEDI